MKGRYDAVVVVGAGIGALVEADVCCSAGGVPFLGAASRATSAFIFVNLHTHHCKSAVRDCPGWPASAPSPFSACMGSCPPVDLAFCCTVAQRRNSSQSIEIMR